MRKLLLIGLVLLVEGGGFLLVCWLHRRRARKRGRMA